MTIEEALKELEKINEETTKQDSILSEDEIYELSEEVINEAKVAGIPRWVITNYLVVPNNLCIEVYGEEDDHKSVNEIVEKVLAKHGYRAYRCEYETVYDDGDMWEGYHWFEVYAKN